MSRFKKLSQTLWHCQYHIVWVPKYRYRVLTGEIKRDVENLIRAFSHQEKCEIIELNVQIDHVHLLVMIPPKISISSYVGKLKGRVAIRILNKFKKLNSRKKLLKVQLNLINFWTTQYQFGLNRILNLTDVVLNISKEVAKYFKRKPVSKSQITESVYEDGSMDISVEITNDMEIIPLVKYWIPHIRVLEPLSVKEAIETDLKAYSITI